MKRIQSKREKAGLLPEELARKAGIHIQTLRKIEGASESRVQERVRRNLAKALKANPADLFTADGVAR